jgi:hypothetical protein
VREITEEWAARPSLPSTPRNLPKAARRTWRHREPNGLGMAVSRCAIAATYLGSLGVYNTIRNHEADKQGAAGTHLGCRFAEVARQNRADDEAMAQIIDSIWDKFLELPLVENDIRA